MKLSDTETALRGYTVVMPGYVGHNRRSNWQTRARLQRIADDYGSGHIRAGQALVQAAQLAVSADTARRVIGLEPAGLPWSK